MHIAAAPMSLAPPVVKCDRPQSKVAAPAPPPLADYTGPLHLVPRRNPVLHAAAHEVPAVDASVRTILQNMESAMRRGGGVGLAAPQVGIPYRLIVVDAGRNVVKMANPRIVRRSGGKPSVEGCLSLKGVMGVVWRSSRVEVAGLNENGQSVVVPAGGLAARCFQHEIDHLEGRLFTDKKGVKLTVGGLLCGAAGSVVGLGWGWSGAAIGGSFGYVLGSGVQRLLV